MGLQNAGQRVRAAISENTTGDKTIVAAVAGKRIVVTNLVLTVATGNTVTWKSAAAAISGAISESYTTGDNELGILETLVGEALVLNLATTDLVSGHLTYVLMP